MAEIKALASLSGGYDLSELLRAGSKDVLFLAIPPHRQDDYQRPLRLISGTISSLLEQQGVRSGANLMAVIDEAAALGRIDWLLRGLALHRSYGMQYLIFFQDRGQLEALYGSEGLATMEGNTVAMFFGIRDLTTAELAARRLGEASRSNLNYKFGPSSSISQSEAARPLLAATEILNLPATIQLVFLAEGQPVLLERISSTVIDRLAQPPAPL